MFQNIGAGAYKPGLQGVEALSEAFGNPHRGLRCVHIAGTNGKGSTASLLAAVLQSAGLKVGLFTSPHLIDFRERIRVNGAMISREDVADFVERYQAMARAHRFDRVAKPSFFELTTVMAFEHFSRQGVDIAVIEVGLGGRLDSTNIITPMLSVITNISLDHTALLGDTQEAIAAEKAGIIKPGVAAVVGEAEGAVRSVFEQKARDCDAPIVFAQDHIAYSSYEHTDTEIVYHGTPYGALSCPLCGDCQVRNAATVLTAIGLLAQQLTITADAVREGFANVTTLTGLAGRWMTLAERPRVICDTGHNPGGWQYLAEQIRRLPGHRHIVLGFVSDKDISFIFGLLPQEGSVSYYFVAPSVKRARSAAELQREARSHGFEGAVYDTVAQGYEAALSAASADDSVFVGGSTFVVADLLDFLEHNTEHNNV